MKERVEAFEIKLKAAVLGNGENARQEIIEGDL